MKLPSTEADERYDRLRALVDRADELPSVEWPAFLERECPGDPAVRAEVLRLLEQLLRARAEGFLEQPASTTGSTEVTEDCRPGEPSRDSPASIGKYQVVRRFAEVAAARRPRTSRSTPTWNATSC